MLKSIDRNNFINKNGVQILFSGSRVYAKGVISAGSDSVIEIDPKQANFEQLERLTINDVIQLDLRGY